MPPGGVVSLIPQYRSYFLSMRQIVFSFEVHLCKYVYSFFIFYIFLQKILTQVMLKTAQCFPDSSPPGQDKWSAE